MIGSNLRQRVEQGLGHRQFMRVKSLGEPAVDLSEHLPGTAAFACTLRPVSIGRCYLDDSGQKQSLGTESPSGSGVLTLAATSDLVGAYAL
jgi:hypothetical protein